MGRPSEFDIDAALEKVMRLFWAKGFESTSVALLTETLGISRPSLYAAFGEKQSLFRAALERYAAGPARYVTGALRQPTAREVAQQLFRRAADLQASSRNMGGCLRVNGMRIEQRAWHSDAAASGKPRRSIICRKDSDPAALARFVAAVVYGMAVLASGGANPKELEQVIRTAMKAWPERAKVSPD